MSTIAFGRFMLDTRRRALLVDGRAVELQSRPFDILAFLIAARDRVVSRDEITAHVWQGQVVAEHNLTVQMSTLRRVLADHGGEGLIITLAGKGYRFVGDVQERPAPTPDAQAPLVPPVQISAAPPPAPRRRWRSRVAAATILLTATTACGVAVWHYTRVPPPPRLSIAVLPFRNFGQDHAQDYLADAISDDLTTDLSHIPGSVVIARESSDRYRGAGVPTAQIGRALHVRYLLEGSVLPEDGQIHINAQLIEAATGAHLWAQRYDQPWAHIAAARNTIVRQIASALDAELTDIEAATAAPERAEDADALTLYYRARSIIDRDDTLRSFTNAQAMLEKAVQKDPSFADGWALLGLTLVVKIRSTDDPDDISDEARARIATTRALQLQMHNATALAADARLRESHGDCTSATVSARSALMEEPNSIDALYILARCALAAGRLEDAAENDERALMLNPAGRTNKPRYLLLAETRLLQGRYPEAIDLAYQAQEGDAPPAPGATSMDRGNFGRLLLIAAQYLNGDAAKARSDYAAYARIWPHHSAWRVGAYAFRNVAALPGYRQFLAALHAAGMPEYADEHHDDHVPESPTPVLNAADFDPTPLHVPGATTIDTAGVAALLQRNHPVIIDLGRGAAVIEGAAWHTLAGDDIDDATFIDHALAGLPDGGRATPVIVMATGTFGYQSYNGALHAVARGARNVLWYRGGEEAWAASGNPAQDRRQ